MTGQDDDEFKDRVFRAVVDAVMEASRVPGSAESQLDVNAALEGMCEAMASLVAALGQHHHDREQGAALIGAAEKEIVERLRFFADKIRSGELLRPASPPNLRIVD